MDALSTGIKSIPYKCKLNATHRKAAEDIRPFSPTKKKEFIAMKKKVLEIGGYDVEFFISQSPEVQEAADYIISINGDGISIE